MPAQRAVGISPTGNGPGAPYNAIFAGTDYHGPISAVGVNCADARRFVPGYAQIGFRGARGRLDFRRPRLYHRFRCRRIRDGDDSGRNFCQRGRQNISFSDSDGQFARKNRIRLAGSASGRQTRLRREFPDDRIGHQPAPELTTPMATMAAGIAVMGKSLSRGAPVSHDSSTSKGLG